MKLIVLAVVAMGCARPLAPGETRCSSSPGFFGTTNTRCQTGQQPPMVVAPPAPPMPGTPVPPRPRVENGVNVIPTNHRWNCFDVVGDGSPVRICASDYEKCRTYARSMKSASSCLDQQDGAACFRTRETVSGTLSSMCFGTLQTCRAAAQASGTADTQVLDDCFVLRYER